MRSSDERSAERLMDDYLKAIGLHRKSIAKDGSCLFRAVAEQVLHCQSLHTEVRAKCVEFLKQNRDTYEAFVEGNFDEYLRKLQDPQQWVGEVEINALAVMYKRDFLIFQEPNKPAVNITGNNFKDQVQLCFLNGNHYDSVYPISHVKNAAYCQSLLYELLYEGVFGVGHGALNSCRRSRASDHLSDDSMAPCASSDESEPEACEDLWGEKEAGSTTARNQSWAKGRGRGRQLPERVRRSLNPSLFRNVEYDVWQKSKKAQQKMDFCIAAGMQYTAGDRCQVRMEGGRLCNATIKEAPPTDGLVTVYIEEQGKTSQVPLWNLRPPSNGNAGGAWSTVAGRDKRLSNGQGGSGGEREDARPHGREWEDRGRGRGRGKNPSASSSAPGSGGRVHKQHSWPPQGAAAAAAAAEEQSGGRPARKSVSTSSSVAKDERLSREKEKDKEKEEEEEEVKNALIEIELRDESNFPALGSAAQTDGGKKKTSERKRNQRKSPIEEVRAASPSPGETTKPCAPPVSSPSETPSGAPAWLGSIKAPPPNMAAVAAAFAGSAPQTNAASSASSASATTSSAPSVSATSVFPFLTPALPAAGSPKPLPPLGRTSSTSPPPPSPEPPPTFIAPIAPPPNAAQGLPPRTLTPSPPDLSAASHTSSVCHSAEAPPTVAQTPSAVAGASMEPPIPPQVSCPPQQDQVSVSQTQTQTADSLPQIQTWTRTQVAQNQVQVPQMQAGSQQSQCEEPSSLQSQISQSQAQTSPAPVQPQTQATVVQSETKEPDLPSRTQTQYSISDLQPQSLTEAGQNPSHSHAQMVLLQSGLPAPGIQAPHPSQLPPPSLSFSNPPSDPSLQVQVSVTQSQTEAPPPPPPAPQPESLPPPHLAHPPQLPAVPPPLHHPSLQGATVPLQQLSQLYQDPLYPGFPLSETGEPAPNPPFSSSKTGSDLPRDINILRFFFNLGLKAYSMPMYQPYIYLYPLQQAHTLQPKPPSRSPSPTPHFLTANPPPRHQELYAHQHFPPTSVAPQYDHHVSLPAEPSEPARFPVTQPPPHRMPGASLPWQPHQVPLLRTPSFPVGYACPSPPQPYLPQPPPPSSQGYPQASGPRSLYPPGMASYPPHSLRYPPPSTPEERQAAQMEQLHHGNGPGRAAAAPGAGPLEAAANTNNRAAFKSEGGENLVLLVDPPLNNMPILAVRSQPETQDAPVSMATMLKPGTLSRSPSYFDSKNARIYSGQRKPTKGYHPAELPEHAVHGGGFLGPAVMATELLSVGCGTEEDWEESEDLKQTGYRGQRRGSGRGRGRGRGGSRARRSQGGEGGGGYNHMQFHSSYQPRGRDRL